MGGEALDLIGREPYVHGARARQIRDALLALDAPIRERDLLATQMDDRALFYARWHTLLSTLLEDEALASNPNRQMLRDALANWSGRADTASVSYRLARDFRSRVSALVYGSLLAPVRQSLTLAPEAPLWHIVTERPVHLLIPSFSSWEELLLDAADYVPGNADDQGEDPASKDADL